MQLERSSLPMVTDLIHYEDLVVGEAATFGAFKVERAEVLAFARSYDPQPFHLDDEAAARSMFGRLAASGWQTCAMTMRMMFDHQVSKTASMGAGGVDELRWHSPVYPGDVLSVRTTLLDKRRSAKRPAMGITRFRIETLNQDAVIVLSFEANALIAVRDSEMPIDEPGAYLAPDR